MYLHNSSSCSFILFIPSLNINLTPSFNPTIPGVLCVPDSYLSGISSGWNKSSDLLPVPPSFNIFKFNPSLMYKIPVPCGPNNPLCPGAANISAEISFKSILYTPAVWEASTKYNILWDFAISDTDFISTNVPHTFDACVVTINLVFGLIASSKSFIFKNPSLSHCTIVFSMPNFSRAFIGLITELCSILVVIIWSPAFTTPFIAKFNDSVALLVNTIFIGLSILNSLAIFSLVSYISLAAFIASLCPALPGFAQ